MTLAAGPSVAPIYILKPNQIDKTVEEVKPPLDINKFDCLKDFSDELEKLCQKDSKVKPKKKRQKVEVSCYRPSTGYVPQETIFSALQRCITSEQFWSKEGLDILLGSNYITPGINDDIVFQCIWKYKSFSSFKVMAKSYIVVPDKYIVKTLKNVIKMVPMDEAKALFTKLHTVDCPIPGIVEDLSFVVLLPINKVSLKDYLKLLTVDEALFLLQCLHFLLKAVSPALATKSIKMKSIDEGVTEGKVVMWLDLVLTAHLLVFTTAPTLNPIISEIKSTLRRQQAFYQDVGQLSSYLQRLKETKTLPEKIIGEYAIETIKM